MPSIAIVVNSFPKLSESFIINKVRLLSENGFDVTVITHADTKELTVGGNDKSLNINIIKSPSVLSIRNKILKLLVALIFNFKEAFQLYALLRKDKLSILNYIKSLLLYIPFMKKYDIVHFPFSGIGIAYLKLFPIVNKNMLTYVSCRGSAEKIRPLHDLSRKTELFKLFQLVDRVHCVSNEMVGICIKYGLPHTKAFVNRPAIDINHFQGKNNNSIPKSTNNMNLVTIGRLHWVKSYETILLAIQILKTKKIVVRLHIAGDGPELEKLIYISHLLQIEEQVNFLGKQTPEQISNLLEQSDIYVHSSISEGISNAVIEAMAMELPVVCTNIGGMNELIDDGVDGILVPVFQPKEISDSILWLIENPDIRIKLGKQARIKIIKEFSLERQLNVYLDEYNTTISLKKQ